MPKADQGDELKQKIEEGAQPDDSSARDEEDKKPDETGEDDGDDKEKGEKKPDSKDADPYKDELERLQADNENYKTGLLNEKDKNKKLQDDLEQAKQQSIDGDELDERIQKAVEETNRKMQADMVQDTIAEVIGGMTDNPSEQKLVKYHYENTINKRGFSRSQIIEDMRAAYLLANRKRVESNIEELNESLKSKQARSGGSASGSPQHGDPARGDINDADRQLLNAFGVSEKDVKKKS